ncbi:hypothetical protein [Mucilaginibacter sp.]|uniref:hypothetical protein n=1 Tax=Mucilaginibacter sp. TaxID=1882438 RepID=UPI003D137869
MNEELEKVTQKHYDLLTKKQLEYFAQHNQYSIEIDEQGHLDYFNEVISLDSATTDADIEIMNKFRSDISKFNRSLGTKKN